MNDFVQKLSSPRFQQIYASLPGPPGPGGGSGDMLGANNLGELVDADAALSNLGLTANGKSLVTAPNYAAMRTNLGLGSAALLASDDDGTLSANSDSNLPTQKAVKTYVDAWGGLFQIRPPTTALFSLSNNGTGVTTSAVANSKFYALTRLDTGAASADRVGFRGKAVPAGSSWTATFTIFPSMFGRTAFFRTGVGIVENSTGKAIFFGFNTQNGAPSLSLSYFSNLNTLSTGLGDRAINWSGFPIQLYISYDGTNYSFSYSQDFGMTIALFATVAKATYFTADRIGLVVESFSTWSPTTQEGNSVRCVYYSDPDYP